MQLLMSFLETTRPAESGAAVWLTLERARKDDVVAMLARLIARAAAPDQTADDEEARDE